MLKLLKSWVRPASPAVEATSAPSAPPPAQVAATGVEPFDIQASLIDADGLPLIDWRAAQHWVEAIANPADREQAWSACELAWLEHLCAALGPGYRLQTQGDAVLLSALPINMANATLAFVNKTVQRIVRVLDGVACRPEWGHDILIVFKDDEAYYRYVAHYYPDEGEFAGSGGMYIHAGCGHFVTVERDLSATEPVIAHELTHACLSHLPIPAWLNEGLAVNTERRLCPPPRAPLDPRQLLIRHRKFWGTDEIQQFWSGKSFLRNDEGNELSYDLARVLVSQFAADWGRFRAFAQAADLADGGALAAQEHLEIDLGAAVCAVLDGDSGSVWAPTPAGWSDAPERGAF